MSEEYTLCPIQRAKADETLRVRVEDVTVDLFADEWNAQEWNFCTKENSAFVFDWETLCEKGTWLWANPRFSQLGRVVAKLRNEKVRMVLLVPFWPDKPWFTALKLMMRGSVLLKRNEAKFRKSNENEYMPAASWDTYVIRVDTTIPREALVLQGNETRKEYNDRSYVERVNQCRGWEALSTRHE